MAEGGLISIWQLDGRGGGRVLTAEELEDAEASDGPLWVHVDFDAPDGRAWLSEDSSVPEVVVEALLAEEPRPRSLTIGAGLLVILRGVNINAGADPEDLVSLRLWLEAGRVISVRRRRLAAIPDIREALTAGRGPADTGDFLEDLVERILEHLGEVVGEVDDAADGLEDEVLTTGRRELRSKLSSLRREIIALRRYIAPQRDALAQLHAERVPWLRDIQRARLRESAERTTRYIEDLDAARERVAVTAEELSSHIAEQMNQTMFILSIVAAIFLPLGLLTGLLGINVGGIPGTEWPYAFALVTVLLVVIGLGLAAWFRARYLS